MPTITMWKICKERGLLWRQGTWFAWCTKNPLRRRNPLPASSDSSLLFLQTCGCTWSTPAWFSPCEEQKAALLERIKWTLFYAVITSVFFLMQNFELVNIWMASNLSGSENQSSQEFVSCFLRSWVSIRYRLCTSYTYNLSKMDQNPSRKIWILFTQVYEKTCPGCFGNIFVINTKYSNFGSI